MTPEPTDESPPADQAPANVRWRWALWLVALATLAALVGVSLRLPMELRTQMSSLDHARDVRAQGQELLATLLDLETSQRGYLLTLEDSYLQPYREGLARLDWQTAEFATLLAGQKDAVADLASLSDLIRGKREELAH